MLVQNNISKFTSKLQSSILQKTSYPIFKSNGIKQVDKLELGNISPLESGLAKLDKITKEEYNSLTEQEKNALRSYCSTLTNYDHSLEIDLESHYFITNIVKTIMDKQFGEGNYVIIPVGRSLSSIGKLLELQIGKDNVKNIPLSNIRQYFARAEQGFESNVDAINRFTSNVGFEDYKKYLSSIGLSRKAVENSNKNYVIVDYRYTGNSLEAAYNILTSDELLGNAKQNIHAVSINEILNSLGFVSDNLTISKIFTVIDDLESTRYKEYSFVGKLLGELEDLDSAINYKDYVKKTCENYDEVIKKTKSFGFLLLDTEFSGKEKPYQDALSFINYSSIYPSQKRKLWFEPKAQFADDVRLDLKEIYKVMKIFKEPVDMLYNYSKKLQEISPEKESLFQEEFKEIKEEFINLRKLADKILIKYGRFDSMGRIGEEYYSTFRPMLFFNLNELRQKFSVENKTKILKSMQARFNQISKTLI